MRAGRIGAAGVRGDGVPRKGILQIPFPQRRVLVTGGVSGIGRAVASAFVRAGCKVAVMDIDKEGGEAMAREVGVRFMHVNVADTGAVEAAMDSLVKAWRDIDIVVSNAGISRFRAITETSPEEFQHVMDVNLRPAFVIARCLALHRKSLPLPNSFGGRYIIISSTRHAQSEAGTEAYSASEGGLASLTHALMMSLSEYGITVNSISPGWINTSDETLTEADLLQHPSRRVGEPEDIARLCLFLAAPGNDFINGADIPVDGGMTRRMIYV